MTGNGADGQTARLAAEQLSAEEQWIEALPAWEKIARDPSASPFDFLKSCEAALNAENFDQLSEISHLGFTRFPDNIWLGRYWARAARLSGDSREAARRFTLIRQQIDSDFLVADHGECLCDIGDFTAADKILTAGIAIYPQSFWVSLVWTRVAALQKLPDELVRRWQDVEMRMSSDEDPRKMTHLLQEMIGALFSIHAYAEAQEPLRKLVKTSTQTETPLGPNIIGMVVMRDPLVIMSAVYSFDEVVRPIMEYYAGTDEQVFFFFGSNMSLVFHEELRQRLPHQFAVLSENFPNAHITFMTNEVDELALAKSLGMNAVLVNNNAFIDTEKYTIRPEVEKTFDAVYNARFHPYKRHILATKVENLRLIMTGPKIWSWDGEETDVRTLLPNTTINERELAPHEVALAVNSARCGLCLSATEGAMYAAIEYLLCGLPVVTTWNVGGRDWWFSGDYTIWCNPHEDEVAIAVKTLISRNISPEHIRETTLQKIQRERLYFFNVVNAELTRRGYSGRPVATAFAYNFKDKGNYTPHPFSYFVTDSSP